MRLFPLRLLQLSYVLAITATTSLTVRAGDACPGNIYINQDCAPGEIVTRAIETSGPGSFLDVVRSVYSESVAALGMKNSPLRDTKEVPGGVLVSLNRPLTAGLFGKNYEPVKQGQNELLQAFCAKHGGHIKTSSITPRGRKMPGFVETALTICTAPSGQALAGMATFPAIDAFLNLDYLFVYYLPAPVAQSVLDFQSGIKPGDKPQSGMIIDTRGAIAKVQLGKDEKWVEVEKLVPNELKALARQGN